MSHKRSWEVINSFLFTKPFAVSSIPIIGFSIYSNNHIFYLLSNRKNFNDCIRYNYE